MGLFSGLGRIFNPDSIAMSQALLAGDYGAVGQMSARRQQLAAQQAQSQREAELAQQQRDDQVWGAKELGVGNPFIAATSAGDLSQTLRERYTPFSVAPGGQRFMPSLNGGQDRVDRTPTTTEQEAAFLGSVDPRLRESYLAKQAVSLVTGTDEQGRPTIQAVNPRLLFDGGFQPPGAPPQPGAQPPPQVGAPPPQMPPQAPPQAGPQRYPDGDREIINGVPYVRQGGRWVPASGSQEAPAFRPAPGGAGPGQRPFRR